MQDLRASGGRSPRTERTAEKNVVGMDLAVLTGVAALANSFSWREYQRQNSQKTAKISVLCAAFEKFTLRP